MKNPTVFAGIFELWNISLIVILYSSFNIFFKILLKKHLWVDWNLCVAASISCLHLKEQQTITIDDSLFNKKRSYIRRIFESSHTSSKKWLTSTHWFFQPQWQAIEVSVWQSKAWKYLNEFSMLKTSGLPNVFSWKIIYGEVYQGYQAEHLW